MLRRHCHQFAAILRCWRFYPPFYATYFRRHVLPAATPCRHQSDDYAAAAITLRGAIAAFITLSAFAMLRHFRFTPCRHFIIADYAIMTCRYAISLIIIAS